MPLRARDLAWLAAMVEKCPADYARKQEVVDAIQRGWKAARTMETDTISIQVTTRFAEDRARRNAEDHK